MGTEIKFHQAVFYEEHRLQVKLNNPLMGTEIILIIFIILSILL